MEDKTQNIQWETTEVLKLLFRQFKLGNSVFRHQLRVDKEYIRRSQIPSHSMEKRITSEVIEALSNFIMSNHPLSITKKENEMDFEYKCELLVLKVDDFKAIVEAAIQMMPMEAIDKIRNGQK